MCRLQAVGTALTDSAQQSISGQKQSAKVEPGSVYICLCARLVINFMHQQTLLMFEKYLLCHDAALFSRL